MSTFGQRGGQRFAQIGIDSANTTGTVVTSDGSNPDTKGAWQEISASTPIDAAGFILNIGNGDQSRWYLVDVAVGASSSEQIICENIFILQSSGSDHGHAIPLPIRIPKGSRVAVRHQISSSLSKTLDVSLLLMAEGLAFTESYGRCKMMGVVESTTLPILLPDAGGTAHTLSTWQEIYASTDFDLKALMVFQRVGDGGIADARYMLDIGIGASSSEEILLPELLFGADSVSDAGFPAEWPLMKVNLPAGTRIAARYQTSTIVAGDRLMYCCVMGFG